MRATLIVIAVVGAALVGATHASARAMCTPKISTSSRTFCGPARGTLKVGGKKYSFKGGYCQVQGPTWSLNIGTIALTGRPKHDYLGITMFSRKAGTHGAAVSWQTPGKNGSLLHAKVTIKPGLKKGTFTGRNAAGGGKATGSFTCK